MDWVTLLILAWVCIAIGFFGANLVNNYRERGKETEEPEQETEAVPLDRQEITRLWRKNDGGKFLVEIDGELVPEADRLNPDQHARISLAMVDLYSWMEAANRAPNIVPEPKETPASSQSPETAPGADVSELEDFAQIESEGEVKPASMNFLKSLVRTAKSEINQKVAPETKSIAEQVDEILQEKIEGTHLESKAIRLMDLPNQGMVIFIGLDKYNDLDQVPDEEIRDLLQESVAEWEEKMLGSLKKPTDA